jgi:hypothetical protein
MGITLVPQPTVTRYLITEKIRPSVQSFSLQQSVISFQQHHAGFSWPLTTDHWPLPSHDFAALAQKCRNVQIVLLEVGDHRAAHAIQ